MNNLMLGLRTPNDYGGQPCNIYDASQDMLDDCAGGCGPGGIGDMLVPDRMWFLSVKPACRVHDWMYTWGVTKEDKKLADDMFLENMEFIIDLKTRWTWLRVLRKNRAYKYYLAVSEGGDKSFFDK